MMQSSGFSWESKSTKNAVTNQVQMVEKGFDSSADPGIDPVGYQHQQTVDIISWSRPGSEYQVSFQAVQPGPDAQLGKTEDEG